MPYPVVLDDRYEIELVVDFSQLEPFLDSFQVVILGEDGSGFEAGLYVTPGPSMPPAGDRLIHIAPSRELSVLTSELSGAETMVFARGNYGEGILLSEPRFQRIMRLTGGPQGELSVFAEDVGSEPFGPVVLTFGPDGYLYATDGALGEATAMSNRILRIHPDGSSEVALEFPESLIPTTDVPLIAAALKGMPSVGTASIPDSFVVGTFTYPENAIVSFDDALIVVPINEPESAYVLARIPHSLGLSAFGQGREFGQDLFASSEGSKHITADGGVYRVTLDGDVIPFVAGIDAISVAFDVAGVMGGGMFVSDGTNRAGPGRIWRVYRRTETDQ